MIACHDETIPVLKNEAFECAFVNNFIEKPMRRRILFELSSRKKRHHILNKLSCTNSLYIVSRMVQFPKTDFSGEIKDFLIKNGAKNSCYVMSRHEGFDQKILSIDEGIAVAQAFGPTFLIFSERMAFFEDHFYTKHLLLRTDGKR